MTIWLDVTTIAGWSRPAVGIIRTEAECARHFQAHAFGGAGYHGHAAGQIEELKHDRFSIEIGIAAEHRATEAAHDAACFYMTDNIY